VRWSYAPTVRLWVNGRAGRALHRLPGPSGGVHRSRHHGMLAHRLSAHCGGASRERRTCATDEATWHNGLVGPATVRLGIAAGDM
jgi:hypothetical protein